MKSKDADIIRHSVKIIFNFTKSGNKEDIQLLV